MSLTADRGSCPRVVRAVFKFPVRGPGPSRDYLIDRARATGPFDFNTGADVGTLYDVLRQFYGSRPGQPKFTAARGRRSRVDAAATTWIVRTSHIV